VSEFEIVDLDAIEAVLEPYHWVFPRDFEAKIEEIWAHETAGKSHMFNGRVLIQHRGQVEGRIFRCGYSGTDYKSFLAWQRMGNPPPQIRNGFAMAALRAADGAFLLGEMGAHTANAGKIYFAAGTPDFGDVVDGKVDLAGSVLREMGEETGLEAHEVQVAQDWTAVLGSSRVAFMRPVRIDLPAAEARALMLERMKSLPEQELADIHIVRSAADIDEARMPLFQQVYLRHAFAG
jgi:8-oxo-dGTP pyrophosphatase MutT (NUDIX family)